MYILIWNIEYLLIQWKTCQRKLLLQSYLYNKYNKANYIHAHLTLNNICPLLPFTTFTMTTMSTRNYRKYFCCILLSASLILLCSTFPRKPLVRNIILKLASLNILFRAIKHFFFHYINCTNNHLHTFTNNFRINWTISRIIGSKSRDKYRKIIKPEVEEARLLSQL